MSVLHNTITRPVTGLSFGPGDKRLIAGGSGGFDIWKLRDSSHTFIASHAVKYLFGCRYDPRGRWVYVSDYRGGMRLLSPDGMAAPTLPGSPYVKHCTSFDLNADGTRLVMNRGGGGMNRVECWKIHHHGSFTPLWSLCDGKPIHTDVHYLLDQARWFTNGVAITGDGKKVGVAESRSKEGMSEDRPLIVLRDGQTGESEIELGHSDTGFSTHLAFASQDKVLLVWDERMLERWDLQAGRRTHQLPAEKRGYYRDLAVHPCGKFFITVAGDGQARYRNTGDLSVFQSIKCGIGKLHSIAISREGNLAAAGGDKGQLVLWDIEV